MEHFFLRLKLYVCFFTAHYALRKHDNSLTAFHYHSALFFQHEGL